MKRLLNLSITDRLLIGLGVMVAIMAFALGFARFLFNKSEARHEYLTTTVLPRSQATDHLEQGVLYVGIGVRGYLLVGGGELRARHDSNMQAVRQQMDRLASMTTGEERIAALGRANVAIGDFLTVADSIVQTSTQFDADVERVLRDRRERSLVALQEYGTMQQRDLQEALRGMEVNRTQVQQALAVALVLAFALAALVAAFTASSIRIPLQALLDMAERLHHGEWMQAQRGARQFAEAAGGRAPHRNELVQIARAMGTATEALEQRDRRQQSTNAVTTATASSLDGRAVARAALDAVCDYVGAQVGVIYDLDPSSDRLSALVTRALPADLPTLRLHEGLPGEAAATGQPVVLRDVPGDTPFKVHVGFDVLTPRCIVAVPFAFERRNLGVLLVASTRDIDADGIDFLQAAARQLGVGIENVRAFDTCQRLLTEVDTQRGQIAEQLEQLQAQHEELQAQHEEMQVQGEELQVQAEEIQAQNEELQAQAEALLEADDQKNRFLGLLAHELRNPMAAISNSLYLLSQKRDDATVAERARIIIERQTRQLARLVDDLLDITRIARGELQIDRTHIDVAPIIRECVDDHRAAADTQGIHLTCEIATEPLPVFGDATRLRQVVGNLIDNAIKFSVTGGRVDVRGALLESGETIVLTVRDNGIGIDPLFQPNLFKPFMQADSARTRLRGGLGLGLSLVRGYIALHAGSVSVFSDGHGKGCEFTVELPVDPSPSAAISARDTNGDVGQAAFASPRRVLVVEDDVDGADSLRTALLLDAHDVRVAVNVDDALRLAVTFRPHVVLCDLGLPDADGYEFARRARADARLTSVRLLALTGYAAPEDKQRAIEAGFDAHLTKPASIEAIRVALAQANDGTRGETRGST